MVQVIDFRLIDSSMEGGGFGFYQGTVVRCVSTDYAQSGCFVVVDCMGSLIFRQLQDSADRICLVPLNNEYPILLWQDGFKIVFKVIGTIRLLG